MITKRVSVLDEKRFLDLVEIVRKGDAVYTNLEMLIHDYEGYPNQSSGGTYMRASPIVLEELKWMGFNIVSTANNHSIDYSYDGLLTTIKNLDRAGLVHCGTGRNLAEARAPAFLDTSKGRVAMISLDSNENANAIAGEARRDMQGRPGLNPLRAKKRYTLDSESWRNLTKLVTKLDPLAFRGRHPKPLGHKTKEIELFGTEFRRGKKIGITTIPEQKDVAGNLRSIKEAKRQADWVLVAHHAHWNESTNHQVTAGFLKDFARKCLNSGADAYIGHGAHLLQGIEIYKRKPIFYSLGNLFMQQNMVSKLPEDFYQPYDLGPEATPQDAFDMRLKKSPGFRRMFIKDPQYTESIIAVSEFERHELSSLKLYPIEMGHGKARQHLGTPLLADEVRAKSIITRLEKLSKPLGTKIQYVNGIGQVKLSWH